MFGNRLDDLVDSSDKEDVIRHRQNRNIISSQLPGIGRDRIVGHSKLKKRIEDVKRDTSDINFFYKKII